MTDTEELPDFIGKNEDYSLTVTLSRSYIIDGQEHKTITLREPTVREQEGFLIRDNAPPERQSQKIREMLAFFSDGFSPDALGQMSPRDYGRVQRAFGFFID